MPYRNQAMRERIKIQTEDTAQDGNGQFVSSGTYSDVIAVAVPARYEYIRGMEKFRGRQVQADVECVFEIRHSASVTPQHSVLHVTGGNKRYGIVSVQPVQESHQGGQWYLHIFCKAIA